MEAAERQEDLGTGDAAPYRAAPHEPVEEAATEQDVENYFFYLILYF